MYTGPLVSCEAFAPNGNLRISSADFQHRSIDPEPDCKLYEHLFLIFPPSFWQYIEAVRNITRRRMRAVDNINLGMYVGMGALAVGLGAHAKQTPQVAMKVGKIFGKIILVGGIAQVGCAAITAQWAKFGAYLDSAKVLRLVAAQIMFDVYLSTWIQLASSAHLRP